MYKSIALFRRKPGISHEEFRDYYENRHVPLKMRIMELPGLVRYVRRYLTPLSDPASEAFRESGFDVITEVWFKDKEHFDRYRLFSQDPEYRRINAEDEDRFLDRTNMYFHTVEEHEYHLT